MKIDFRVTTEQYALIAQVARDMGMTPGQYARFSALQSANLALLISLLESAKSDILSAIDRVPENIVAYRNKLASGQIKA